MADDIIDAEFEMVGARPSAARQGGRVSGDGSQRRPQAAPGDDNKAQLGVFGGPASNKAKAATPKRSLSLAQYCLLVAVASIGAFLVSGGYAVMGQGLLTATERGGVPVATAKTGVSQAAIMSANAMTLNDMYFEQKLSNGREYLSVEGTVRNDGQATGIIPALRLVFGPEGEQARYRLERGESLKPGEQLVFTSRIPLRDTEPLNPALQFIQ